jgi:ribosome maturation factor RimP
VSSPGIERKLKKQRDFERFACCKVSVKFFKAFNGEKVIVCTLLGRDNEKTFVETDNGEKLEIENKLIAEIKLYVEF